MKRRLRELARAVLPESGVAGADHVLIGRGGGVERPFDQLVADLCEALARIRHKAAAHEPGRAGPASGDGGTGME